MADNSGGASEPVRHTAEEELKATLINFWQNRSLFVDNKKDAVRWRQRLSKLLGLCEPDRDFAVRAVTVMKAVLICPDIIEIKGRPGFKKVAAEFSKMLECQATARFYGAREEDLLYGTKRGRSQYRTLSRREATLAGIFSLAWKDLTRPGDPGQMVKDMARTNLVHKLMKIHNLDEDAAISMLAAIEGQAHDSGQATGIVTGVNLGTATRPLNPNIRYGLRDFVPDERMRSSSKAGTIERQIRRSIETIKNRFELKEIPSEAKGADLHVAVVLIPKSYESMTPNTSRRRKASPRRPLKKKKTKRGRGQNS